MFGMFRRSGRLRVPGVMEPVVSGSISEHLVAFIGLSARRVGDGDVRKARFVRLVADASASVQANSLAVPDVSAWGAAVMQGSWPSGVASMDTPEAPPGVSRAE